MVRRLLVLCVALAALVPATVLGASGDNSEKLDPELRALDAERENLYRAVYFGLGLPQTRHPAVALALSPFAQGFWLLALAVTGVASAAACQESFCCAKA